MADAQDPDARPAPHRETGALPPEARRALPLLILGRFASNVGVRFPFSFIAPLARGLGVSVDTMGLVLGLRELTGLAAPALGRRSDAGARHRMLAAGLAGCGAAMALGALSPGLVAMAVAMVAFGLGKGAHDTSSNGWIGDHVPFSRRGRITGLVETSWALALVVGVPLMGVLIARVGWRSPFVATAVLTLAVAGGLRRVLGPDVSTGEVVAASTDDDARAGRRWPAPPVVAAIGTLSLLALAMQLVTVALGPWLEDEFGFSVAAVGTASILLGLGELVAAVSSARFTDVLGKRRSVLVGMAPMVPCLVALAWVEGRTALALALFTVVSIGFEFAFVSALPILTELAPDARATTVGQAFASFTTTRALATVVGAWAYVHWGMAPLAVAAAAITVVGIALVITRVEEPAHPER